MFDRKKLEAFLNGLQVETHFPSIIPQKIAEPQRSPLDRLMDKYDVFVQGGFNHNWGIPEFPVYGPKPKDSFSSAMSGWATFGGVNRSSYMNLFQTTITGIGIPDEAEEAPVETPYTRLKMKLNRLSVSPLAQIVDPNPPPASRSPDFVHTITAWRGWEFTGGMLEALGSDSKWEPRQAPRANCRRNGHAAPSLSCGCGYWSFKSQDLLVQALERYSTTVDVIGQVEIWGRVIECENGFRSEYAYPKELWLLEEGSESLSWKYGVPVRRLG